MVNFYTKKGKDGYFMSLKWIFYLNLAFANAVQQLRKLGTTEV